MHTVINRVPVTAAAFLLAAAFVLAPPLGSAAELPACTAHPLPLTDIFVSAAQTADGNLLIADYNNERLVEVELGTGTWDAIGGVTGQYVDLHQPVSVHRVGDQIWLERATPPLGIVTLSSDLEVDDVTPPRPLMASFGAGLAAGDRDELRALWMWKPIGTDEIVACGRVLRAHADPSEDQGSWENVFVRYSLEAPGDMQVLRRYDQDQLAAFACRLKLPLIATLGDTAYILGLEDDGAVVYAAGPDNESTERMEVVPQPFAGGFKPWNEKLHYSRVPGLLEEISRLSIPAGLFAWEDALYLLSRSYDQRAARRSWWLTRVRVGGDSGAQATIEGTIRIDSAADNLMVVPGDDHWALIEKGPAQSYYVQATERVITVPAERLRAMSWQSDLGSDLESASVPSLCGTTS